MRKSSRPTRKFVFDEEGLTLLANKLKLVRSEKGFTQEELPYQSGLTLSQIARIETIKANPTVSTIFKIARTLNISVSELFDFKLNSEKE